MKIDKIQNNNINFGFNYNTHRKIADIVIANEFPKLKKYIPIIREAVQAPDFDELGIKSNTHFYYPFKSYIKPRSSFLDFDWGHNARSRFNKHIDLMYQYRENNSFIKMVEQAGRAKHFLDDMSIGLHVERGNFIEKIREMKIHKNFEDFLYRHEDEFIAKSSNSNIKFKDDGFDDIFMSVVNNTKDTEIPNANNVQKWPVIAQNSINSAMDASRVFFKKVSDLLM